MKTKLIIGLFICLALTQIVTPLSMIAKRESVLKNGAQFKFVTAPVDPYDAFRGRYVALRFKEDSVPAVKELRLNRGQAVYALIETDDQGFARLVAATVNRPYGNSYIQAKVQYVMRGKVYLDLPINRYYMEEQAAKGAERIYFDRNRRGEQDAYVVVRIKDGLAVIEDLFVGGQRIEDAVKEAAKRVK